MEAAVLPKFFTLVIPKFGIQFFNGWFCGMAWVLSEVDSCQVDEGNEDKLVT